MKVALPSHIASECAECKRLFAKLGSLWEQERETSARAFRFEKDSLELALVEKALDEADVPARSRSGNEFTVSKRVKLLVGQRDLLAGEP